MSNMQFYLCRSIIQMMALNDDDLWLNKFTKKWFAVLLEPEFFPRFEANVWNNDRQKRTLTSMIDEFFVSGKT